MTRQEKIDYVTALVQDAEGFYFKYKAEQLLLAAIREQAASGQPFDFTALKDTIKLYLTPIKG